jgi:hypothetical protein
MFAAAFGDCPRTSTLALADGLAARSDRSRLTKL